MLVFGRDKRLPNPIKSTENTRDHIQDRQNGERNINHDLVQKKVNAPHVSWMAYLPLLRLVWRYSFIHSFLPSFIPSFLPSFVSLYCMSFPVHFIHFTSLLILECMHPSIHSCRPPSISYLYLLNIYPSNQ